MADNAEKLYFDTNIYITLIKSERGARSVNDIECHRLFCCIRDRKFTLICSDFLLDQLKSKAKEKGYTEEGIKEHFSGYSLIEGKNMVTVKKIGEDFAFASDLQSKKKNIDYEDAVHYHISKRAGARFFVTYNVVDFQKISDNPAYVRVPSDFANC